MSTLDKNTEIDSKLEVDSVTKQRVSAHLLFLFFKLTLGFGLDFEFRLR